MTSWVNLPGVVFWYPQYYYRAVDTLWTWIEVRILSHEASSHSLWAIGRKKKLCLFVQEVNDVYLFKFFFLPL